jgi:hypothetical protein
MPSSFESNVVLEAKDEKIAAKSWMVPMWNLQVACLSATSILH